MLFRRRNVTAWGQQRWRFAEQINRPFVKLESERLVRVQSRVLLHLIRFRSVFLGLLDALRPTLHLQLAFRRAAFVAGDRLPQRRQAQASRLPGLHPSRHHLPGTASVPRRCLSPARLELVRLLAANDSPRHPALRARRRHRATPQPPRISLEYPPKLHLREFHHRATGHQQNAGLPPRRLTPKFRPNSGLANERPE